MISNVVVSLPILLKISCDLKSFASLIQYVFYQYNVTPKNKAQKFKYTKGQEGSFDYLYLFGRLVSIRDLCWGTEFMPVGP